MVTGETETVPPIPPRVSPIRVSTPVAPGGPSKTPSTTTVEAVTHIDVTCDPAGEAVGERPLGTPGEEGEETPRLERVYTTGFGVQPKSGFTTRPEPPTLTGHFLSSGGPIPLEGLVPEWSRGSPTPLQGLVPKWSRGSPSPLQHRHGQRKGPDMGEEGGWTEPRDEGEKDRERGQRVGRGGAE